MNEGGNINFYLELRKFVKFHFNLETFFVTLTGTDMTQHWIKRKTPQKQQRDKSIFTTKTT